MQIFNELTYINNSSLVLGYFDGLHLGHKVVLKNAINFAKENNIKSTVIIFRNHPLNVISNKSIEQILTLDEKLEIFQQTGIDNVILLNFEDYAAIKAAFYLENIIVKYFSPLAITTGFNHSFGFNKEGNNEFLRRYSKKYGYKYFEIPPFTIDGNIVSCSIIKNMIKQANFYYANKLLGYNFFIREKVITGDNIASKMGFASANIVYPVGKIQIPFGVYFVKVKVDNKLYSGILNHGYAPTINNTDKIKMEVHIINFNDNIYGKKIEISFIAKIRNQIKFDNIEKLKAQIIRDIAFTEIHEKFLTSRFHFL